MASAINRFSFTRATVTESLHSQKLHSENCCNYTKKPARSGFFAQMLSIASSLVAQTLPICEVRQKASC
jgi:hypothetical protein